MQVKFSALAFHLNDGLIFKLHLVNLRYQMKYANTFLWQDMLHLHFPITINDGNQEFFSIAMLSERNGKHFLSVSISLSINLLALYHGLLFSDWPRYSLFIL